MATKIVADDGAVVASWAAGNSDAVRMGSLAGGKAVYWIETTGEIIEVSMNGSDWFTYVTAAGNNEVDVLDPVPLYIRAAAGNTGDVIVTGWQDR